jgi:hypothetical protein
MSALLLRRGDEAEAAPPVLRAELGARAVPPPGGDNRPASAVRAGGRVAEDARQRELTELCRPCSR